MYRTEQSTYRKMMRLFILMSVLQILSLYDEIHFSCPSQTYWTLEKYQCIPPSNYTCFFDVTFTINVYRDRCNKPRLLPPGYTCGFWSNLKRATCRVNRYQTFMVDTVWKNYIFHIFNCNSEGQAKYENGTSTSDLSCICNTFNGNAFVMNSKEECYCFAEEFSCFIDNHRTNKRIKSKEEYRFKAGLYCLLIIAIFILLREFLKHLQARKRLRYKDIKQSSKTEKMHLVHIGIGRKTWLFYLRRLLMIDISSKDGVDFFRSCIMFTENGDWTIEQVITESINQLPAKEGIRCEDMKKFSITDNKCFVSIMIFGNISASETWMSLKNSIDDVSSKDGVNIVVLWIPTNIDREQVIKLLIQSQESQHLYAFMNATGNSLPAMNIQQKSLKRFNEIQKMICDLLGTSNMAIVGSSADGLYIPLSSDMDVIMFPHNFEVFDCIKEPFNMNYKHAQLIRVPDKKHPGYSKLRVISLDMRFFGDKVDKYTYVDSKDGILYLKNNVKELLHVSGTSSKEKTTHGPAHTFGFDPQTTHSVFTSGHSHTFQTISNLYVDVVLCISSKQWPVEAFEWTTRQRPSNWPTKELVDHIINTGYILAGVGSKESNECEIQWRVSFNEAEQLLIESFNETQIHCIFLLKYLKNTCLNSIAGKNITSYTIKTVMFWCLEDMRDEYWQPSNLVNCFCLCVSKLKFFVKESVLPNYFITERNQFVADELTCDIKTKIRKILKDLIKNPNAFISLLLPSYRDHANTEIHLLHSCSQVRFIETWLKDRIYMIYANPFGFGEDLLQLYDGYNIQCILKRCNTALEKLMAFRYTQPLIKKLQNYMGVLHYLLLKETKETGERRTDSDTRKKYSKYMKLSASADLTHAPLRIATCYLDDGVKEDCLNIILKVTESDGHLFMRKHDQCLNQTLNCDIEALNKNIEVTDEIDLYVNFIYDIDLVHQDPYRTTNEFEKLREKGHTIYGYDTLNLAWKKCYFDVTFMLAELPILPKPAAVELCIDNSQKHISFHPILYALLLNFLWHEKYGSVNREKESVLEKFENYVSTASVIPDEQKSVGLNFMAYCYSLQKDNQLASRCLVRSLKLNPIRKNVAYWYMWYKKYRIKRSRELSLDSKS